MTAIDGAHRRSALVVLAIAGGVALLLGLVGIYGVALVSRLSAHARDRDPAWRNSASVMRMCVACSSATA